MSRVLLKKVISAVMSRVLLNKVISAVMSRVLLNFRRGLLNVQMYHLRKDVEGNLCQTLLYCEKPD